MDFIKKVPEHLKKYIVDQDYSRYTPIDQAVWRYTLRQLKNFLSRNAHSSYLGGLEKTGITIDRIPSISEISEKLKAFGWQAVPVSGFIPPAAFMEMQSLSILPIASDMRTIDHILYTPAPDIVHEAAGHAPLLSDIHFSNYLKQYAQISKKALISKQDLDQYEAIRDYSDIKEDPDSTPEQIKSAEERLNHINKKMTYVSEATLLSRMNWWTAEYGLVGDFGSPKIYGAGLLSSIGESRDCLTDKVKKIPLTVDCVKTTYDITEPQPQLFVTPDFSSLTSVLNDLAKQLSFTVGGEYGLEKSLESQTVNTIVFDTGLEVSGKLVETIKDKNQKTIYFRMEGPSQLSLNGKEIPNQGTQHHAHGFSSPLDDKSVDVTKFKLNERIEHVFSSGIKLVGVLTALHKNSEGAPLIATFKDCQVTFNERVLFDPAWGVYDMALGSKVISVYAGPADRECFGESEYFVKKTVPRRKYTELQNKIHNLYQELRNLRENKKWNSTRMSEIFNIIVQLKKEDWLLPLEIYELCIQNNLSPELQKNIEQHLNNISKNNKTLADQIQNGLKISKQVL